MTTRRMRSRSVALGLTLVAAQMLSGCGGEEQDYQGICMDPVTEQRLDDDVCEDGDDGSSFVWFYMATGHSAPPVGSRVNKSHGVFKVPSGKNASRGGVPNKGGAVTRGGFGSGFGGGGKTSS